MELYALDSNFQPDHIIEKYSSLIWTERYATNGDFQLVSTDVARMVRDLPLDSYVSLRDTTQVMKVEVHNIEKDEEKGAGITITGRTFECTALELRASVNALNTSGATPPWNLVATKESDAAFQVMRTVLGDAAEILSGKTILPSMTPAVSANDAIPEVKLILPADYQIPTWDATSTYSSPGTMVTYSGSLYYSTGATGNLNKIPGAIGSGSYWTMQGSAGDATGLPTAAGVTYNIPAQGLYKTVNDLLAANFRGIKSVKPAFGENQVGIEIYNGTDRRDQVRFEARLGQLNSGKYLLSNAGSANVGYVYSSGGADIVPKNTWDMAHPEPSGLNRRVLIVDATSDASANSSDARKSRGLVELYQNNATALFGGEVGIQIGQGYNNTYFLGDILKLVGDYGLSSDVRVAEFIRSEDNTGEKSYPTLEAVT